MNHDQQCGSVAFLEHIVHPISVARKVMEETPHVMLVGKGALQFAEQQGFKRENLLTEASEKAWRKWLEDSKYAPVINYLKCHLLPLLFCWHRLKNHLQ